MKRTITTSVRIFRIEVEMKRPPSEFPALTLRHREQTWRLSIIKANRLMLLMDMISVFFQKHMKYVSILCAVKQLTLILLTWTIWRAPTNASKWRMGFNSAFKGLIVITGFRCIVQEMAMFGGFTQRKMLLASHRRF